MTHHLVFERCKVGYGSDGYETILGEGREEEIIMMMLVGVGERRVREAIRGPFGGCCCRREDGRIEDVS